MIWHYFTVEAFGLCFQENMVNSLKIFAFLMETIQAELFF